MQGHCTERKKRRSQKNRCDSIDTISHIHSPHDPGTAIRERSPCQVMAGVWGLRWGHNAGWLRWECGAGMSRQGWMELGWGQQGGWAGWWWPVLPEVVDVVAYSHSRWNRWNSPHYVALASAPGSRYWATVPLKCHQWGRLCEWCSGLLLCSRLPVNICLKIKGQKRSQQERKKKHKTVHFKGKGKYSKESKPPPE